MKKRILFVIPSFEIGGTVVSVRNLIYLLDKNKYDITVMPMQNNGTMMQLYEDVRQQKSSLIIRALASSSWKSASNILYKFIYAAIRVISHIRFLRNILLKLSASLSLNKCQYDIVVASQEGFCTKYVSYFNIPHRISWVRCDYERYLRECRIDNEVTIYRKYKSIVCVSELIAKSFKSIYPEFESRIYAINNPQSLEYIYNQADIDDKDIHFKNDKFTIVSVGRFDRVKRFTYIPFIASYLKRHEIDFNWYIIGGGDAIETAQIKQNIESEEVTEFVHCLGIKSNPHYYIKKSDLLVSLSRSEACPRVINEAKILHTPVVCTDFPTAYEYIKNGYDGIIAPFESIHQDILEIIQNREKYNNILDNISKYKFNNTEILNNIDQVFYKETSDS